MKLILALLLLTAQAQAKIVSLEGPTFTVKVDNIAVSGLQTVPLIKPVTHTATPQDLKEAERLRDSKPLAVNVPYLAGPPNLSMTDDEYNYLQTMPNRVEWKCIKVRINQQPQEDFPQDLTVEQFLNVLEPWQAQYAKVTVTQWVAGLASNYEYRIFYPSRKRREK